MASVVCHVAAQSHRITFRWSEGERHFEPYHLHDDGARRFWAAAELARERLRQSAPVRELADAGHRLFQEIFPATGPYAARAAEIRGWLAARRLAGGVAALEIVGDTTGLVPWPMVYDQPPQEADLGDGAGGGWQHFWGMGYALGVTYRVNPLRRARLSARPTVLLALDPAAEAQLSEEARHGLAGIKAACELSSVTNMVDLDRAMRDQVFDIHLLLGQVDAGGLRLVDGILSANRLRELLSASVKGGGPWNDQFVGVIPFGSADAGWHRSCGEFLRLRLSGLITVERPLAVETAARVLVRFLDEFVNRRSAVGLALQRARTGIGADGLALVGCCPPEFQVVAGDADEAAADAGEELPLPEEPYRPLVPLDHEERSLLVGRDQDVGNVCDLLDTAGVGLVLLHGRSGVGKSSLLHAGVLPYLLEEGVGYLPLRDRSESDESVRSEDDYPLVALRATQDLLGQLAPALAAFTARPWTYTTPTGRDVTVDLAGVVANTIADVHIQEVPDKPGGPAAPVGQAQRIYAALRQDRHLLARLLLNLAERLPAEPLLVVEQAEELFSLSRTGEDVQNRLHALAMLQSVVTGPSHTRVILSANTNYVGRLTARLCPPAEGHSYLAEYLLPGLNVQQLAEVISRPTAVEAPRYSDEVPAEKYGFEFEEGLPARMARQAIQSVNEGRAEALPLVHAVCALLYGKLQQLGGKLITAADVHKAVPGFLPADPNAAQKKGPWQSLQAFLASTFGSRPTEPQAQPSGLSLYVDSLLGSVFRQSDKQRLLGVLEAMYSRQPDGSVTRTLLTEEEFTARWPGPTPPREVVDVAAAPQVGLLDERVAVNAGGETTVLSLGHDALAPVMEERQRLNRRRQFGRSRVSDTLWLCIPVMLMILLGGWFLLVAPLQRRVAKGEEDYNETVKVANDIIKKNVANHNNALRALYPARLGLVQGAWKRGDALRARQLLAGMGSSNQDLHGFEWRYLQKLTKSSRFTLEGHNAGVIALGTTADGKWLFSAGADGVVRAWDAVAGRPVPVSVGEAGSSPPPFVPHGGPLRALAVSPGGKRLVTAGADGAMKVWNVSMADKNQQPGITVKERHSMTGDQAAALAFADDDLLASGGAAGIILWDAATGKQARVLKDHASAVTLLAVAPGGKTLASADGESVILWDLPEGKKRQSLEKSGRATALDFTPDGKRFVAALAEDAGSRVRFWDAASGKAEADGWTTATPIRTLAFLDDKSVVHGGEDRSPVVQTLSGKVVRQLHGHLAWVNSLIVDRQGRRILSGADDSVIRVWDSSPRSKVVKGHEGPIHAVSISPNGSLLATGGADGTVKVWDMTTREKKHNLTDIGDTVRTVAFAQQEDRLLVAAAGDSKDGKPAKLLVWDAQSGKLFKELKGHSGNVTSLAMTFDGKFVAAGLTDGTVQIWKLESGEKIYTFTRHKSPVRTVTFFPKTALVASGGDDGRIYVWWAEDGMTFLSKFNDLPAEKIASLQEQMRHAGAVTSVAFLNYKQVKLLASGGADGFVKLWDLTNAVQRSTLSGHRQSVTSFAWGSESPTLISAGQDGTVRLWSIWINAEGMEFDDHAGPVRGVALSADQTTLVSVGDDGMIRFYEAEPEPRAKGKEE